MRKIWIGAALLSLTLAGGGTLSKVDSHGQTEQPFFPDVDKLTFHRGFYPNSDNLRQASVGITRDQLYELSGRPHYAEGFKTCQYKVLFDKNKLGRSFYWKPSDCASVLHPAQQTESLQSFSSSGDEAFVFGFQVMPIV